MSSSEVPVGPLYHWVPDKRFELLSDDEASKPCRYTVGPDRRSCKRPSVARLNRSSSRDRTNWWHYCERHLFGRRIRDGVVEIRIVATLRNLP